MKRFWMIFLPLYFCFLYFCLSHLWAEEDSNPVEVGTVSWHRDFSKAQTLATNQSKPIFALFQEVPGCSGCKKFGREVLTSPLLVEAIESEFVPVVIYNNKGGKDAEILQRYGEPSWNFQVIRFLDSSGKDILPRKDRVWTLEGVTKRTIKALESQNRTVPNYLKLLEKEQERSQLQRVAFAMYCFWTGEMKLGQIPGVWTTEAGWLDGMEVTLVEYDPKEISLDELTRQAAAVQCAQKVFLPEGQKLGASTRLAQGVLDSSYRKAQSSDQKRQIRKIAWQSLHLTPIQQTKLNAFAPVDFSKATSYLSPRQIEGLKKLLGK